MNAFSSLHTINMNTGFISRRLYFPHCVMGRVSAVERAQRGGTEASAERRTPPFEATAHSLTNAKAGPGWLAGWLSVPGIWPVPGSRFGTRPSEIARGAGQTRLPVTAADKECSLLDGRSAGERNAIKEGQTKSEKEGVVLCISCHWLSHVTL
ncbi:hypothetical protein ASPVEDRAFT_870632 [Aspergillus versicolor CBS 583.65]|uniref:Uncharacterized protein n=1 Tax=Aspergillus versicolor CBS 583.65 TaxID=1036611 RepID=A0A1L9PWC8_ASPVE|nr:uncharacterized protein ASPVEDRAFT_870632 [Aspergillus versicolor CBS 583.65]OJJ05849.1 hypothetical protein ASPVEDRAFT_870632 [Aspergillus versicolor CBS 583.65]